MYNIVRRFKITAAMMLTVVSGMLSARAGLVAVSHTAPSYTPGAVLEVSCEIMVAPGRNIYSLLWRPQLPEGWTLAETMGDGGPEIDIDGKEIIFLDFDLNAKIPLVFSYSVNVPLGASGGYSLGGSLEYLLDGMVNPMVENAEVIALSDVVVKHEAPEYLPGTTITVTCSLSYPTGIPLYSLLWRPELPSTEWKLVEANEVTPGSSPAIDPDGECIIMLGDISANPLVFSYDVEIPPDAEGDYPLSTEVEYLLAGMVNPAIVKAAPNPLILRQKPDAVATHSVAEYLSGREVEIACSFESYTDKQLLSLLWRPILGNGWELISATGAGAPEIDFDDGSIIFLAADLNSPNPLDFSYIVRAIDGANDNPVLAAECQYQYLGMVNPDLIQVDPNPLEFTNQVYALIENMDSDTVISSEIVTNWYGITLEVSPEIPLISGTRSFSFMDWQLEWDGGGAESGDSTNLVIQMTNDVTLAWRYVAPLIAPSESLWIEMDEDDDWIELAISAIVPADPNLADQLQWFVQQAPTGGVMVLDETGAAPTLAYKPRKDWNGEEIIVIEAIDSLGGRDQLTIYVTVHPVNDAPETETANLTAVAEVPLIIDLHNYCFDVDGDELEIYFDAGLNNEIANGIVEMIPSVSEIGTTFTIDYWVSDGEADPVPGKVLVTVVESYDNYLERSLIITSIVRDDLLESATLTFPAAMPTSSIITYYVEQSADLALGEWVAIDSDQTFTPDAMDSVYGVMRAEIATGGAVKMFYRVRATLDSATN